MTTQAHALPVESSEEKPVTMVYEWSIKNLFIDRMRSSMENLHPGEGWDSPGMELRLKLTASIDWLKTMGARKSANVDGWWNLPDPVVSQALKAWTCAQALSRGSLDISVDRTRDARTDAEESFDELVRKANHNNAAKVTSIRDMLTRKSLALADHGLSLNMQTQIELISEVLKVPAVYCTSDKQVLPQTDIDPSNLFHRMIATIRDQLGIDTVSMQVVQGKQFVLPFDEGNPRWLPLAVGVRIQDGVGGEARFVYWPVINPVVFQQ